MCCTSSGHGGACDRRNDSADYPWKICSGCSDVCGHGLIWPVAGPVRVRRGDERLTRYLFDFAESFVILFGAYINVLAGGLVVLALVLVIAWATIPHIAKRV